MKGAIGETAMPTFRQVVFTGVPAADGDRLRRLIAETTALPNFFVGGPLRLTGEHRPEEDLFWELFRGRVLDGSMTRERRRFEAWNVHALEDDGTPSTEPLVSVKLDAAAGQLHVTRAVQVYAHESYDAGGNVIQTRETVKWQRELVGTLDLRDFGDLAEVRDELASQLFQAVVGTGRLPLTSLEAPLPAFSLGRLGYFHRPGAPVNSPPMTAAELIDLPRTASLAPAEQVKHLELVLRAMPPADADGWPTRHLEAWQASGQSVALLLGRLRETFNAVALSPYTDFADKALTWLRVMTERGTFTAAERVDFLAHLLRQLGRHLSAYDLVTFHHRGANYPDALLLDTVWRDFVDAVERRPSLLTEGPEARRRRRALRSGWLLQGLYAGHPVPDAPTSPGENLRVLPAPFGRVPEEQIHSPAHRQRRLFTAAMELPQNVADLLGQSLRDFDHPSELGELGTALFLDRPLGFAKAPGEPDQTPLLSYEAFSFTLVADRLHALRRLATEQLASAAMPTGDSWQRWEAALQTFKVIGISLPPSGSPRPGVVSLDDARRVRDDFRLLRSTRQTVRDFLALFDLSPLSPLLGYDATDPAAWGLIVAGEGGPGTLDLFDRSLNRRAKLRVDLSAGYRRRAGVEFPRAGLIVESIGDARPSGLHLLPSA
jgi:hypothetical protein